MNDPIKVAVEPDGKRYMEVHQPLSRNDKDDPQTMPIAITPKVKRFINDKASDKAVAGEAIARRAGMPILISNGIAVDSLPAADSPAPASLVSR